MGISDMTIKKFTSALRNPKLTPQEREAIQLQIEAARKDAEAARVQQAIAKEIKPQQPRYK